MNVQGLKNLSAETASRLFSVGLGLTSGAVLAIALWLTPSPAGHGTHMQLGLGNCTFLTITGYPCPMCGCTTTFSLWAHLHPIAGIVNQPFGSVLFLMTLVAFGTSVAEAVQPRNRWVRLADAIAPYETQLATLFLAAMTFGWLYKIAVMRFFT